MILLLFKLTTASNRMTTSTFGMAVANIHAIFAYQVKTNSSVRIRNDSTTEITSKCSNKGLSVAGSLDDTRKASTFLLFNNIRDFY